MQTVLLVENNSELSRRLEQTAEGSGRQIFKASNKGEAVRMLLANEIDLVVTDLALRSKGLDTDGLDILKASQAKDPDLPVVVVSAYFTRESTQAAYSLGAFDLVDRGAVGYVPQDMLRIKITRALRFREALKLAANAKERVEDEKRN